MTRRNYRTNRYNPIAVPFRLLKFKRHGVRIRKENKGASNLDETPEKYQGDGK